ncbi:MAG: hypothetical protein PVG85_04355 [Deltaproteobacteria bacterium]
MKTAEANGVDPSVEMLSSELCEDLIDKGLIAMFLKLTPEERLQANNNAVQAILELQDAFRRAKQ